MRDRAGALPQGTATRTGVKRSHKPWVCSPLEVPAPGAGQVGVDWPLEKYCTVESLFIPVQLKLTHFQVLHLSGCFLPGFRRKWLFVCPSAYWFDVYKQ